MSSRELDVVVLGASGFTGQLVMEYLAQAYGVGESLNWAIAGRSQARLEAARDSCLTPEQARELPLILADSNDPDSLAAMAARTRVVCTTVGPYARYGTPVVAACAAAGTHYCDLAGEVQWITRVISEYEQVAVDSGARIVHCCGFDSVPSDMGTWYLQQLMHERHGVYATHVKGRVGANRGAASGGTIASILNMLEEAGKEPEVRRQVADPYALYPSGVARGLDGQDQRGAVFDTDFDQWTSPFVMAAINTRVVRRSNALLGFPWGEDFRYDESTLNRSRAQAAGVSLATGAGMLTLAFGPTRKLAARFLPKPGDGPDRSQRESGFYELFFHGIAPDNREHDMRIKVRGDLDPGYGSTSRMLGEAAVCLAQDSLAVTGGFWTPASALGQAYLDRLQTRADITFTPVDI